MYILTIEDYISAAHQLRGYKGKCENIHGHNWKVEVSVYGEKLNELGILIDFHDLKDMLKEVLQQFDHKNLNDVEEFLNLNPSSELLSKIIYQKFDKMLKHYSCTHATKINILSVTVWESATCRSTYRKKIF
ncbi:MAG: 6-carboxytetrahydropterin synthase QueD [Spirochaetes bacterium]|nr:6-carboxytetrahydropterin synthase QueD [Spirochaetota bacterium]